MPARFHRKRSVASSIRRIAVAEIEAALAAIRDPAVDDETAVHLIRQRIKALRALIRLPGPALGGFREENIALRDLARLLAHTRDSDVVGKTFDAFAGKEAIARAGDLRAPLLRTVGGAMPATQRRALLQGDVTAGLVAARRRARKWQFRAAGYRLLGPGLTRVYKAMLVAESIAAEEPSAEHFHEWRKQARYHAEQLGLLTGVAPEIFAGYRAMVMRLCSALGRHHDLDVMAAALLGLDLPEERLAELREAIARRNGKLESKAFRVGLEVGAERPADFSRRVRASWKSWRHPKHQLHALRVPPA